MGEEIGGVGYFEERKRRGEEMRKMRGNGKEKYGK